jgi:hypothetical protein
MRALYPGFAQKLADLLPRIAANDREVEYINAHALPRGGPTAQGVGNNGAEPAVVLRAARWAAVTRRSEVRFRGQNRRHLLSPSFTGSDPKRSFAYN